MNVPAAKTEALAHTGVFVLFLYLRNNFYERPYVVQPPSYFKRAAQRLGQVVLSTSMPTLSYCGWHYMLKYIGSQLLLHLTMNPCSLREQLLSPCQLKQAVPRRF